MWAVSEKPKLIFSIRGTPLSDFNIVPVQRVSMLKRADCMDRKTLDNNELNQVVASSGFSENKGWGAQSRGLINPSLGHSY